MKSLHGGYLPDYPSPYLKDIYLILPQRLVLGDLQNLHSLHWGMYRGITWSPTSKLSTFITNIFKFYLKLIIYTFLGN